MNVTEEQYQRAAERRNDRIKRIDAAQKKCMTVIFIIVGISAVFCIIGIISKKVIFTVIFLLLLAAAAVVYILMRKSVSEFSVKELHTPVSSSVRELQKLLSTGSYSDDFMSRANYLLSAEKDIYARGHIRDMLTSGYFFRGEFDTAFRTNFRDEELFQKDRYYELVYLKNTAFYYFNMPSTTGGTEYGEEAYRNFTELCKSGSVNMKDISVLNAMLSCEIDYALAHGDHRKALDNIDILSAAYNNAEQSHSVGSKTEYAELILRKTEAMNGLGQGREAKDMLFEQAEYLKPFPYRYNKAQQLLQAVSQTEK